MNAEIILTAEQSEALAIIAGLHGGCGSAENAAACDNLVRAVADGVLQKLPVQGGGAWLLNVLVDVMKAGLVDDGNRPAFAKCRALARELDARALNNPLGTA